MQKYIAYLCLLFFSLAYVTAVTPEWMAYVYWSDILPNMFEHHGDLYNISRLPGYDGLHPECQYIAPKLTRAKKVKLVIIGDSYVQHMTLQNFSVDSFDRAHWDGHKTIALDTNFYNILIIEVTERYTSRFTEGDEPLIINAVKNEPVAVAAKPNTNAADGLLTRVFGNTNTEQNIEFLLFNNSIANRMKEAKANLNYHLFNRLAGGIAVSPHKQRLYYSMTVDSNNVHSSFYPVPDKTIDACVGRINTLSEKYKAAGFNRVAFSIIPNAITVVEPETGSYNHKIERIANSPLLHAEYIDAYKLMMGVGEQGYYYNDTHWNCEGQAAWLNLVNNSFLQDVMKEDNINK